MKRLILILSLIFTLYVFIGCNNGNKTKLRKEIAVANAECPVNMGISGDLISMKYQEKENRVVLYFSINEEVGGYIFLKENRENMMKQFRLILSNPNSMQMIKDIINAQASLLIIYKAPSSGKIIKFSIPYEQLIEIKNNPLSDKEIKQMSIENSVAMQNATCPGPERDGMRQTKVAIVDNSIVYYIQLDEKIYDVEEMQRMSKLLKDNVEDGIKSNRNDPIAQKELKLLNSLGMGYTYRYYGKDSKKYVDVIFTPEELSRYIAW